MKTGETLLTDTFYDNQKAKQTLIQWIKDGRLPHAILLEGEDGSGKTSFARMIAAANLCNEDQAPCGKCRNCKLIMADTHPDVIIPKYENRFRSFPIKELRQLLATTYIKPNDGDNKVYILRNIHFFAEDTQNAMLKAIEEPPANVFFILTCNSRSRLLPTVLSRVALVQISLPTLEHCKQALLAAEPDINNERINSAVIFSQGNIGKALSLLQDEIAFSIYSSAILAAEKICLGQEFELLSLFQPYANIKKREQFLQFLDGIRTYYLEILHMKNNLPSLVNIPEHVLNRITILQTMQIIDIINSTAIKIVQNVSPSLAAASFCGATQNILNN